MIGASMPEDLCPECGAEWETIIDPNGNPGWKCSVCGFRALDGPSATWNDREYQANRVQLLRDGDQICALIGRDLVQGVGAFGSTVPEALRNLADQLIEQNVRIDVGE
jgi:hypothetical protein